MNNKFYIGLDIGTNSVGWCVTDEDYNIARLKGKTAFGSYIFSEAEDCKQRRQFRANKRRINRRKYRIYLLNLLFSEEINKVDKTFFLRLSNSTFNFEDKDKRIDSKYLLFKDKEKEVDFYKKYPTIWHLRNALIKDDADAFSDIRNLYLAIHHIIKYRGNFLKEGVEIDCDNFDVNKIDELNVTFKQLYLEKEECEFDSDIVLGSFKEEFEGIYFDDELSKKEKQSKIKALFEKTSLTKYVDLFAALSTGGKYSLSKIFDDELDIKEIQFNDSFDENVDFFKGLFGESFKIVEIAKEINDFVIIHNLIGENLCLSESMIDVYETHKKDLKLFKDIVIQIDKANKVSREEDRLYHLVFKDKNNSSNYAYFVKQTGNGNPQIETFNKFVIKEILEKYEKLIKKESYDYIYKKCVNNEFLSKISITSTSLIPHQLHLNELRIILNNSVKHYPEIGKISSKIEKLFLFRVPFYYGPLDDRSKYSNIVRKSNEIITPWNFHDSSIIDDTKTRIKFMNRLINNCQYLIGAKVLPKSSLIYEDYMIYDRINNLIINGAKVAKNEKKDIYNYIIGRNKTTVANLKKFLSKTKNINEADIAISGISEDVPFVGSSHNSLAKYFDLDSRLDEVDEYIKLATIYADDKRALKDILSNDYKKLSLEQKKAILNLPTNKWASVSREFLTRRFYIDDNGEAFSIIELMKNTLENFQQIFNNPTYNFKNSIAEYNFEKSGEETESDRIDNILENTPSLFRRSINKTLALLDDIKKASKQDPSKIFIEVTRENDEKKKRKTTLSRGKETDQFLKDSLKKEIDNELKTRVKDLISQLNNEEIFDSKIKSKHIYLYFKQLGFDLYTGQRIDLNDVINSDRYDLDHIIPQSLIKDDSLDNLVLVDREYNQRVKSNIYPLPQSIFNEKNVKIWTMLHKMNAISDKKYNNLTRRTEITLEELEEFVQRQINIVNYSNIALRDILNIKYPKAKIVFSKAQYPHLLREEYEIVKNRDLNDAHHAVDAYLNVVSGDILTKEFNDVRKRYIEKKSGEERTFNMDNVLLKNCRNFKERIVHNSLRHDALVTYANEYIDGAMYKQTIYSGGANNGKLIPIHTDPNNPMNNVCKYGGYDQLVTCFLIPVSYKEGKKEYKKLMGYKLLDLKLYGASKEEIEKTLVAKYLNGKITEIKIGNPIYYNQKVKYGNGIYCIYTKGDQLNLKNAYQSYLDNKYLAYLKYASKYSGRIQNLETEYLKVYTDLKQKNEFVISKEKNLEIFDAFIELSKNKRFNDCNYLVGFRNIEKEFFANMAISEQIGCLNEIIKLFSNKARYSRYRDYFGIKGENIFTTSLNVSGVDISVIYESPSGLFNKIVKL